MATPLPRAQDGLTRTATSVYGTTLTRDTAPLIINIAYTPQWDMRLNGLQQPIEPSEEGLVKTQNDVHSGENHVELTWHRTTIEQIGIWITALSIITVVGLLLI